VSLATHESWKADTGRLNDPVALDDRKFVVALAQTLVQVLKQCGDNLTRENVMHQAASLKDFQFGMLLPGIKINTSATDFYPIKQMQMQRFNGERWQSIGPVMRGEIGGS